MAFTVTRDAIQTNKRYKAVQHYMEFRLNTLPVDVIDPQEWLKSSFKEVFIHLTSGLDSQDKVGLTFSTTKMDTHIPFKIAQNLVFEDLWHILEKISQSNAELVSGDDFKIIATSFSPARGRGRITKKAATFHEDCVRRKGIVVINNRDNLCFVRALVVAIAYAMNVPYIKQLRLNTGKRQDQEAHKLIQDVGISVPPEGVGFEEIKKFQAHLKDFQIMVYNYGNKGRDMIFKGPDAPYRLNLLHHNNHYNVITSLTSAFSCSYYCEICNTPFNSKDSHRCQGTCPCCQQSPPCPKTTSEIECSICNRKFRGQCCFDNHKNKVYHNSTVCQQVKKCSLCLKTIPTSRKHICNEVFCKICNKHRQSDHLCYIQKSTGEPSLNDVLFVFYDLECRQDQLGPLGEKLHIPNLCVYQQRCPTCFDEQKLAFCQNCGFREGIFEKDPVNQFMSHLLKIAKKFKNLIIIAHNGQGYDHQFVLKYLLEQTDLKPEIIKRGSKLIMMIISNIKFLDSLNYFPMPLAALPGAFDLKELKKGYFPFLFSSLETQNYVGPMPATKFYAADDMKNPDRLEFLKWYEEHKNDVFDFRKELIEYCRSDVDILTQACLKFHKMFMEQCNVSPFTESCTIPGACSKLFRRNYLKPDTIGIIPKKGYRLIDNQSKIATQWLIYEENKRGIIIQHAVRGKEVSIGGLKVDGSGPNRQIFEFMGCYYHGCPICFTQNRDQGLREDSADSLNARYERTLKKSNRLRNMNYDLVIMWEHEFRNILEADKDLKHQLDNHPLLTNLPLSARDAFYGGRTGNCKTFYECKPGEKIKYVDVCSLYPWVCKHGKFPIGHPTVYLGDECCKDLNIFNTNGLIKCKILPPRAIYHPVLPSKINGKLMFTLCRSCAQSLNVDDCGHNEEERALLGTWVADEVVKALEMGYVIVELYEVWQYKITQYDGAVGGLFAEMMNKFIKVKQEASGWPQQCQTQGDRDKYIESFFTKEGIRLEYDKVLSNPGLRSLAKLILNSFWGKFGQRENQERCSIIRQPIELYELDNDPGKEILHINIINEDTLIVSWQHKEEAAESLLAASVAIASYVTTQARLKLFSYLEVLGDRVLYYDTDSVIYVSRPDEYDIPTGSSLGEMTDELEIYGLGSYIIAFSSAGPKNYSYVVHSPVTGENVQVCKVKGIKMSYKITKQINFDVMKQMVTSYDTPVVKIETETIRRDNQHQVVTLSGTKSYRPCLEKRKFTETDSVPYGYKRSCLS